MSETFNWSTNYDEAADALKPFENGKYRMRVRDSGSRRASTGSPMVTITLEALDGPRAGKTHNTQIVMSLDPTKPMGRAMFFNQMAAFGLNRDFFVTLPSDVDAAMAQIADAIRGRTVVVTMGIQQDGAYKGRNEVRGYEQDGSVASVAGPSMNAVRLPSAAAPVSTPVPASAPPASSEPITLPTTPAGPPVTVSTAPAAAAPSAPPDLPI